MIIVKHILLRPTIRNLILVSEKYNLHMNAKKSNWLKIKNHKGTTYTIEETKNIAQANRYTYLGVSIDQSGKIYYKEQKATARDKYIRFKTNHYSKKLSFEN